MPSERMPRQERRKVAVSEENIEGVLRSVFSPDDEKTIDDFDLDPNTALFIHDAHIIDRPLEPNDAAHLARVKARRPKVMSAIERETDEHARFMEQVLIPMHEANLWFGEDAHLSKTVEFDDSLNHTDLVLRLETADGEVLYLAIDVTVSNDADRIAEKIERVYDELESGAMTTVKYYEDPETHEQKSLVGIPRVVIPFDRDTTILELKTLAADFFSADHQGKDPGFAKDAVARSSWPIGFLKTAILELQKWEAYVHEAQSGAQQMEMVRRISKIQELLRATITARKDEYGDEDRPLDATQRLAIEASTRHRRAA